MRGEERRGRRGEERSRDEERRIKGGGRKQRGGGARKIEAHLALFPGHSQSLSCSRGEKSGFNSPQLRDKI